MYYLHLHLSVNNENETISNYINNDNMDCYYDDSDNNKPRKEYRKILSNKQKNYLLDKQENKCANILNSGNVKDENHQIYNCLLWEYRNGLFDKSKYQADHINEFNISKDNSIDNFQLLCSNCHSVKTQRVRKNGNFKLTTEDLDNGQRVMNTR